MVLSSLQGKGGGERNKFHPGAPKTPKHVGKPNVIAYRATDLHAVNVEGYNGITVDVLCSCNGGTINQEEARPGKEYFRVLFHQDVAAISLTNVEDIRSLIAFCISG